MRNVVNKRASKKTETLKSSSDRLISFPLSSFSGISLNAPIAGNVATNPDGILDCDGIWDTDVVTNPAEAKTDLKIKINNIGECTIESLSYKIGTMPANPDGEKKILPNRPFIINLPPGYAMALKCCKCDKKSCKYNITF